MPTERLSQRFVDPAPWMIGEALVGENSAVAALSHSERGAFLANGMPVAFTLSAHRGYVVAAAARELRPAQAMAKANDL